MSLAGTPSSILRMVERRFATLPDVENPALGWTFRVLSAAELTETLLDYVTLFVYKVDLDATRRHDTLPPVAYGQPSRVALALELRFLLIVWGKDARRELQVLGKAMEFLDERPILTGDDLDPAYAWLPGAALKVGLDQMQTHDMLQLWDALTPSFRLSVPYHARTIRLTPRDAELATPPVDTATTTIGPTRERR